MQKIISLFSVLLFAVALAFYAFPPEVLAEDDSGLSNIVISEVQTGSFDEFGSEDGRLEFVEIFNPTAEDINLSGWKVEGLSASGASVRLLADFNGILMSQGFALLSFQDYIEDADIYFSSSNSFGQLGKGGGHVRIIDENEEVVDQVGWGSADSIGSWPITSEIPPGYSVKRVLPGDELYGVGVNFTPPTEPITPEGGSLLETEIPACDGVIISELLSNPAGADPGSEFIELYNPTSVTIGLDGCGLQLNTGEVRIFGNIELVPSQYIVFYDNDTSITLPNVAGGTIYLLSGDSTELYSAVYPGGLDDDVAWAWFGGNNWQQTYSPTPGAANINQPIKPCPAGQDRSEETGRCSSTAIGGGSGLQPCRADQFRNPLTNRCKLKDDGSGLQPCRPDQFRNTETNRCKLISSASSSLKPCNGDQFRNPATNRCKKIDSGDSLKPCDPDQERNPETNRCRKVRGATSGDLPKVEDVEAPVISGGYSWLLAGVAGGGVVAYAGWEWRRELLSLINSLKARLPF